MSFHAIIQKLTLFWQKKRTIQELFDDISQIYCALDQTEQQDFLNWLNTIAIDDEKGMISVILLCFIPHFQQIIALKEIKNQELHSFFTVQDVWINQPVNWIFTSSEVACFQSGRVVAVFSLVDHTTVVTIPKKLQHVWICCNCNDEIMLNNTLELNAYDFYILLPSDEK